MIEPNNIYLGDSYELIKEIPDKSIDLIYTDIPYFYVQGGGGKSTLGKNAAKKRLELMGINNEEIKKLVENENTRSQALSLGKKANNINDMENGIDFAILDEFVRIQPYIYIYMV